MLKEKKGYKETKNIICVLCIYIMYDSPSKLIEVEEPNWCKLLFSDLATTSEVLNYIGEVVHKVSNDTKKLLRSIWRWTVVIETMLLVFKFNVIYFFPSHLLQFICVLFGPVFQKFQAAGDHQHWLYANWFKCRTRRPKRVSHGMIPCCTFW